MSQIGSRIRAVLSFVLMLALVVGMIADPGASVYATEGTSAQEETVTPVQSEHPYLYLNNDELADLKTHLNETEINCYGFSWKAQYEDLLRMAEDYLVEKEVLQGFNSGTFVTFRLKPVLLDPNHPYYNKLYKDASIIDGKLVEEPYLGFGCLFPNTMRERLEILSLAYLLSGDTRYSDQAISYALQMCEWDFWGDREWLDENAHGVNADASNAWATQGVAAVYDLCYDQLTEDQKQVLIKGIMEKGLAPISRTINFSTSNANMMFIGGMLTGIAAIYHDVDREELQTYIDRTFSFVTTVFDDYAYSGKTEGMNYTSFGLEYCLPGVMHYYRATGAEDLVKHPLLSEMLPYWTVMCAAPQSMDHPNYSDGAGGVQMKLPMAVISKVLNHPLANYFLTQTKGLTNPFQNLVYLDPQPVIQVPTDHVAVIDPIGYGALRTGFAEKDTLLTMLSSKSAMGHNHYDQNAIQFNVGGTWVISDPGTGSYYYEDRTFWTSAGHSTILVDGNSQTIKGTGSLKKVFSSSLYGYIIGSAPKAYGVDTLTKFDRHAIQINHRQKPYYIVIDDLDATQGHEYSWQMYNGESNGFYVDGALVPEMTTAKGNDVSMTLGAHRLNLSFVENGKLRIENKFYEAKEKVAGYTLVATSAASKAHQFMTVIHTEEVVGRTYYNFSGTLTGESTAKTHQEEGGISWKSSSTLGKTIVKSNIVGTLSTVFFRGGAAGDYIKLPFVVKEDGVYDATLMLGVSDGCCKVKVHLEGKESIVVDCSGLPETTKTLPLLNVPLSKGLHYLTIEVVGPGEAEDYAEGWYLINAGGLILDNVEAKQEDNNKLVSVVETYDTRNVLGALINYTGDLHDLVLFNRGQGTMSAGDLTSDAEQASVLGILDGRIIDGFAATKATTLKYGSKELFKADKKISIVADDEGWHIDSTKAQSVQLRANVPEVFYVTVNGQPVDVKVANGMITVPVEKGWNDVVLGEGVYTPPTTDPTGPEQSDPQGSTPAQTEPGDVPGQDDPQGSTPVQTEPADGTPNQGKPAGTGSNGWILWTGASVAVAAAGVTTWWFVKKRKKT